MSKRAVQRRGRVWYPAAHVTGISQSLAAGANWIGGEDVASVGVAPPCCEAGGVGERDMGDGGLEEREEELGMGCFEEECGSGETDKKVLPGGGRR